MSQIITPKDLITITIDNTANPPQVSMRLSRDLPGPYVAMLLGQLIASTMATMMNQMVAGSPVLTRVSSPGGSPDA